MARHAGQQLSIGFAVLALGLWLPDVARAQHLLDAPGPGYQLQKQRSHIYRDDLLDALPAVRFSDETRAATERTLCRLSNSRRRYLSFRK
jgi:hypothetical protein